MTGGASGIEVRARGIGIARVSLKTHNSWPECWPIKCWMLWAVNKPNWT